MDDSGGLQSKNLLVVNGATPFKEFIFKRIKNLGVTIICMHTEILPWLENYVDQWIITDIYDYEKSLTSLNDFVVTHPDVIIGGAITFQDQSVALTSQITDKYNRIGIPYDISSRIKNKYLFRENCERYGIPAPKRRKIDSTITFQYAVKDLSFPLVLKPIFGMLSIGTTKVEKREDLEEMYFNVVESIKKWEENIVGGTDIVVEEYIDGQEVDMDILIQGGEIKFFSITDNDPTSEPYFVETGQCIPSRLSIEQQNNLKDMAYDTLKKFGIVNACVHFEAKYSSRGPVPIEVNLRMGGDEVHSFVYTVWGVSLADNAVKIALGIPITIEKPAKPLKYLAGSYFLPDKKGIVKTAIIPDSVKKDPHTFDIVAYKKEGDSVGIPPEAYDYLGWITVQGDSSQEVDEFLMRLRSQCSIFVE